MAKEYGKAHIRNGVLRGAAAGSLNGGMATTFYYALPVYC